MDFKFTSLPLIEVIKEIQVNYRKVAAPKNLNVVVGEHLRDLVGTNTVTLDVKQVTVGEVLNLLGMSSQRGIASFSFVPVASSGGNPTFLVQSDSLPGYPAQVVSGRTAPPLPRQKSVAYFPLEPYLDRFKVEDITTAMKIGWDLSGAKEQPTMKFHEETKLLIVSGDEEQMQVVPQVLQSLSLTRQSQPGAPSRPAQRSLPVPAAKP